MFGPRIMPYYGIDPEKYRIRGENYGQSNGGQGTQKRYYPACQKREQAPFYGIIIKRQHYKERRHRKHKNIRNLQICPYYKNNCHKACRNGAYCQHPAFHIICNTYCKAYRGSTRWHRRKGNRSRNRRPSAAARRYTARSAARRRRHNPHCPNGTGFR